MASVLAGQHVPYRQLVRHRKSTSHPGSAFRVADRTYSTPCRTGCVYGRLTTVSIISSHDTLRVSIIRTSNNIWPRLMQSRMNQETGSISRPTHVPSDGIAIVIDKYHITRLQQSEVAAQRV